MRVLITIAFTLVACTDPKFDVHVELATVTDADGKDLADQSLEINVKVIDATAAGIALAAERGEGYVARCADLELGYLDPAVIEGATRTSVQMGRGASLTGVPRLGKKLVLVEARNRGGRRFAAGCTEEGDIEDDTTVTVKVEVAPSVQVSGRTETTEPSTVGVLLTTPWDDTIPLPGHLIRTELYAGTTALVADGVSPANGYYVTPQLPRPEDPVPPPGPAQTLVRVKWADDVVRLPAFLPWSTVATAGNVPITLGAPVVPGPRGWAIPYSVDGDMVAPIAATLQLATDGTRQIAVISYDRTARRIERKVVNAPNAAAVVVFGGEVFSLVNVGWAFVGANNLNLAADQQQVGVGPATEIHNVRNCLGAGGLLVRRLESPPLPPDTTQDEVYTGYDAVGVLAAAGSPLATLATELNASGERVLGAACVTLDAADAPEAEGVVLTRGAGIGLRARLLSDPTMAVDLPNVTAIATFLNQGHWLTAGVETTISGPHVQSYKLAELAQPDGSLTKSFITTPKVDTRLADQPGSLDVADIDGALDDSHNATMDVVAAISTPLGPLLQVSLGRVVDGEPLSAVTDFLPGDRTTTNPVLRFFDLDPDISTELLVLMVVTDQYVMMFCPNERSQKVVCAP